MMTIQNPVNKNVKKNRKELTMVILLNENELIVSFNNFQLNYALFVAEPLTENEESERDRLMDEVCNSF
jgi:hypothetical protein